MRLVLVDALFVCQAVGIVTVHRHPSLDGDDVTVAQGLILVKHAGSPTSIRLTL